MIKFVAFDLDGTIGDTLPLCLAAFRKAVEPYLGRTPEDAEIAKTFGLSEEGMMKILVGSRWQEALDDFHALYDEMHSMCPAPFPGMRDIMQGLSQKGIGLGLITGKGKPGCDITVRHFGLDGMFDFIGTGSPERNTKGDTLRRLFSSRGLSPDEVIYVGDTVSDVLACREAGVRCLSAAWSSICDTEELEKVNKGNVLYSIDELRRFFGLD